jgi:hypothetical protein
MTAVDGAPLTGDPTGPDVQPDNPSRGACLDCGRRYGDEYGFPDLIVDDATWELIHPGSDGAGLLCPSCMCRRAHKAGIRVAARFTSGPFCADDPS